MANPLWIPGSKSANPTGRPKSSVRSVRGMVERFVRRNITPNKLQKMFNSLTSTQQIEMLLQLLPYAIAKQSPEGLNEQQIDELYSKLEQFMSNRNVKAS